MKRTLTALAVVALGFELVAAPFKVVSVKSLASSGERIPSAPFSDVGGEGIILAQDEEGFFSLESNERIEAIEASLCKEGESADENFSIVGVPLNMDSRSKAMGRIKHLGGETGRFNMTIRDRKGNKATVPVIVCSPEQKLIELEGIREKSNGTMEAVIKKETSKSMAPVQSR
jgi:hypothetical protein